MDLILFSIIGWIIGSVFTFTIILLYNRSRLTKCALGEKCPLFVVVLFTLFSWFGLFGFIIVLIVSALMHFGQVYEAHPLLKSITNFVEGRDKDV